MQGGAMAHVLERAYFADLAPDVLAYVERFRAHKSFRHTCMNLEVASRHWERTAGWEKGVKCQLSIDIVVGVIDGELLTE